MPQQQNRSRTEPAGAGGPARAEPSIEAFRRALEASVTISRNRLQDLAADVRRGRMTRGDAEDLAGRLATRGRRQTDGILAELERLATQLRDEVGARTADQRRSAARTADRARREFDDAAERAREQVGSRAEGARERALGAAEEPLAAADRARRRARVPAFPISAYAQLSIREVDGRLGELPSRQLRRVRDYDWHRAPAGVLRAIDRRLTGGR